MSEVKRAKLISFGSQRVNNKNTKDFGKTVRIAVILPESTEDKCPEFNYKDLFAAAKRKDAVIKAPPPKPANGLDPFNEEDEDVKRIAAEMEAKYGMGVAKKRKWRKDDYADIGMGYDESDSFIDNTDGYDEIIPKNVTTLHGGFYINCGALEFKTDEGLSSEESSSSEEDTPEKASVKRKRVLESSAESEEEAAAAQTEKTENVDQQAEKKQKIGDPPLNTNGMQKAIKKRLFSHDKIKQQMREKKRPEEVVKKTVRELLRERREDLNMTLPVDLQTPDKAPPSAVADPPSSPKDSKKPLASVDDVIESVISGTVKKKDEPMDESSKDSSSSKEVINNKSVLNSSEADSNDATPMKMTEIVLLPENLPSDIIGIIESLKKAAACSTEGKVKFFSGHVNIMLFNLERKCRCLGKQSRMKVYEHLAPFLKCRKETLIKRAKNLCVIEEQKKIKTLLDRLKGAVGVMMQPLIENYEAECRTILQKKFCLQNEDAARSLRMPKRHFPWNDEIKKLVKEIIILRKKCYINEGKQKESLEKHLTEFIKTDLHVIWPEGWMSINTLLKYCNFSPDIKRADSPKKLTPILSSSSELSITPSPTITTPNITLSATSSLTITPVTTIVHKVSSNEIKAKPKMLALNSETIISKISTDSCSSVNKPNKPLPSIDIVKTMALPQIDIVKTMALPPIDIVKTMALPPAPDVNNVKFAASASNSTPTYVKDEPPTIVIEDSPLKKDEPENLSSQVKHEIKDEPPENSTTNHYQVIDLTDLPELKKRPGPKSKTKYLYDYTDKLSKPKKDSSDHLRLKSKEEITGSSALTQIIADSLSDLNRFGASAVINNTASVIPSEAIISSSYDYPRMKVNTDGDDIQKVMEGLKVLQKMSSPVKSNDETKTSSPVSVIAFNKSYSHDSDSTPHSTNVGTHRSNSFQDAFQKHFIPDYQLLRASQAISPTKGSNNSLSRQNHTSSKSGSTNSERYLQNSNNNYAQQNSNKLKTSCSSQQSGSYNMLDDMFANFLSEYGHSKTANSKSSTPHK